jgi:glycosyltransferase involved in cell wall biosynthesis
MSRPAILLIMRDPPEIKARKGGLFPTAIQHHVALGLDVHVASLSPMQARHCAVLAELGATPLLPVAYGWSARLRAALGRPKSPGQMLADRIMIDRIGYDIAPIAITGLQSCPTGIVARTIAQSLNKPYVTWEHISSYQMGGRLPRPDDEMRALFEGSHATAVVSPGVAQAISARFGIDLPQAQVVPNPLPTDWTDPPATPAPGWIADFAQGRRLIGAWTSWRRIKRLDLLLKAFALLHRVRPDCALVVAGPLRDETPSWLAQFQAAHPELADAVHLPGNLDRATIKHLAASVDCCCVSSEHETFGLAVIEALALGTPVVATRCGGPEYIIGDDPGLGRVCPSGDASALAQALQEVLDSPGDFDQASMTAKMTARYGEEALLQSWRSVYAGILPKGKV